MASLAPRNPQRPPNIQSYSTPSIASSGHSKHVSPSIINQPITLTKRLLFPHLLPTDPIPPLLTSLDVPPALNAELYDFIALALRAYVNPWWSRITRYDREFLFEITRILTVVIRALEARMLGMDLNPLIFRDLPAILTEHLVDYRAAAQKLDTSYALGGSSSLPALFHARQQHIGVTAEGQLDEVYLRTAIDAVLKACLSEEDWEPDPERYIIREVVLKVICQDVVPKITQPWFIYKTVLDSLGPAEAFAKTVKPPDPSKPPSNKSTFILPSFQTLVVFFLSSVQAISSTALVFIHLYKQAVHTIKVINHPSGSNTRPSPSQGVRDAPSSTPLAPTPTKPPGPQMNPPSLSKTSSLSSHRVSFLSGSSSPTPPSPPIQTMATSLAQPPLTLVVELFTLHKRFASSAIATISEMLVSAFRPFLDRLLPHFLYTHVLTPSALTHTVSTAKRTLFPNGYPAPAPPDPTPEEQAAIRAALAARIAQLIPNFLSPFILGPTPAASAATLDALLDPFNSQACNAHLALLMCDLFLGTLFPELLPPKPVPSPTVAETDTELEDDLIGRGVSITPPGSMPP